MFYCSGYVRVVLSSRTHVLMTCSINLLYLAHQEQTPQESGNNMAGTVNDRNISIASAIYVLGMAHTVISDDHGIDYDVAYIVHLEIERLRLLLKP